MKVLLAIDQEACSEEAVNEVGSRRWDEGTVVRVLHTVGTFVPPAQELWHDAGGDLDQARREIKDSAKQLAERAADWLREQGLAVETAVRDGDAGPAVVEEAEEWGADLIVVGSRGTLACGVCSKAASRATSWTTPPAPWRSYTATRSRRERMAEKVRVLILCTGNSARSQMAEGLLREMGGDRFEVESAGVAPSKVRPEAIEAMREVGIDISGHRSKSADEFAGQEFDYIITVCDNARETCPVFPGGAERIHRSFEDPPAPGAANHASTIVIFRRVRDEIRQWLKNDFIPAASVLPNS